VTDVTLLELPEPASPMLSSARAPDDGEALAVRFEAFGGISRLARLWCDLEARSAPPFFLSWIWIGAWLETVRATPLVLAVYARESCVGLGLVVPGSRSLFGLRRRALILHEVGDAAKDVSMIEDNGFLAARGYERAVAGAALRFLGANAPGRIVASGVDDRVAEEARLAGWCSRVVASRPCPYRMLDPELGDDLAQLSRNARSQIARSMRLYEVDGPLTVTPSSSLAEAHRRFDAMGRLHQQRWVAAGKPGAFAFPAFKEFHRRVLAAGFSTGSADVLRIAAGSSEVGYLYNFFYRDEVYAYQNGFAFGDDQRLKPGLVSHLLAFAHYRRLGARRYRFLAGDSRYKRTLSTGSYDLHWLVLGRDDWMHRAESLARHLRSRLRSRHDRRTS